MRALSLAAAALPGTTPIQAAEGDALEFGYGHYVEGPREVYGSKSKYHPIQVDSVTGGGQLTIADRWKLGFKYLQDTWSGATPVATAPFALGSNHKVDTTAGASPFLQTMTVIYDKSLNFYREFQSRGLARHAKDNRVVHTLASASPETRKQGNLQLGYAWDQAALDLGLGLSLENDYDARFVSLNGRMDFDQKRTVVNMGVSYTHSAIDAILDPEGKSYFEWSDYFDKGQIQRTSGRAGNGTSFVFRGERQDWAPHIGLTQVLNKNATFATNLGFTRGTGLLENPYKTSQFIFLDFRDPLPGGTDLFRGDSRAVLEHRPDVRNQWTIDNRFVQYIEPLDAALHLGYRYYHDDWGIDAHTFEADWSQPLGHGWTVTPSIRYYSQSAADFYQPYFVFRRSVPTNAAFTFDLSKLPVTDFSSDHRLSGYGALSGGLTVTKQFAKGISLEGSFEYYTHAGGLKLGGGGEGSYADFNYYQLSGALKVALDAPAALDAGDHGEHRGHAGHGAHNGNPAPAGIMFGHMLKAGEFMAGYRYMYSLESGPLLHQGSAAADAAIVAGACGGTRCGYRSQEMSMHMHMLDLMYAPADWLNLMLMPQFVDMGMVLGELKGGNFSGLHASHAGATMSHATGGVGDTGLYGLVRLFDGSHHHLHAGIGITAPTGDVDIRVRHGDFIHYGMQLGSGTWDFKPSLTYSGDWDRWSWGGQLSATKRLESRNDSGFAFGDTFQSTVWGSYRPLDWLSASVRGLYTVQGSIRGQFIPPIEISAPVDLPSNYGGRYFDVGLGLTATIPAGGFQGHQLGVEWLQPVDNDPNGYQLERKGSLFATWSLPF